MPAPLSRRNVLAAAGGLAAAGLGGPASADAPAGQATPSGTGHRRRPNIVLYLTDDLGYGETGSFGNSIIRTPHLDRMAEEGVRFTQYYAGAPVCAPSRATLLTGLHTGHAPVRANPDPGEPDAPLGQGDVTVADVLRGAGYRTGLFGKWGFCPDVSDHPGHPNRQGFEQFFGQATHAAAHDYYPPYLWSNHERYAVPGNADGAEHTYAPDLVLSEALGFIERHRDDPFFCVVSSQLPHSPQEIPRTDPVYEDDPRLSPAARRHCSQVGYADRQVGALLGRLRELGLDDDTVVLFASDNGPTEEDALDPHSYGAGGGLRGYKRNLFEGGIRVPLIVRAPGRVHRPGSASDQVVASWDLLPTLAALAGAGSEVPEGLDGVAMHRQLLGAQRPVAHRPLYFYRNDPYTTPGQAREDGPFARSAAEAVRVGDWKAVRFSPDRERDHPDEDWHFELYDLARDPAETTDVADRHPRQAARLLATMKSEWREPR